MKRFRVDDVEPAPNPLPTRLLGERYRDALAFGGDPRAAVIDHGGTHPLLAAVGRAFADHRPLVLSPDAVWLTIAQGVAQHVRLHAEALRGRLVRHDGRKRLTITTGAIPADAAGWASAIDGFRALLASEIGLGRARLLECNFSTTTHVERLASQIVLFDAYTPYFSLWMTCVCGIPEITLLGTPEDWQDIRARIDVIAELDLESWCRSLRPICDHFMRAAHGDVDVAFWRRIYNPVDAYGGDVITGWITRFYPYVKGDATTDRPNPMLELAIDEPKHVKTKEPGWYDGPGIRSDAVPASSSRVIVRIVDHITQQQQAVALVAGVTAVAQDAGGALCPIASWHLEPATVPLADVIERIAAEHAVTRAVPSDRRFLEGPRDVVELYAAFETATLFAGERTWRFRAPNRQAYVELLENARGMTIRQIADLPGGKSLCAATRHATGDTTWIACRVTEPAPDAMLRGSETALDRAKDIAVLGSSLAALLDAALDSNGDYEHLRVGTFDELLH